MELWTSLLAVGLFVVLPSVNCFGLNATVLIGCVFIHRTNVTCKWTTGDPQTTLYTLNVQRMTPNALWNCSTTNTSCTVLIEHQSVNFNFCVSVTAHSHDGKVTTAPRCQLGINEIMLHPVTLKNITQVDGRPQCLTLNWQKRPLLFMVTNSQIQEGKLESQIEFKAHTQSCVKLANVRVTSFSFVACLFSPNTEYTVRLRHRYNSNGSIWGQWSNESQGRTAEDAPSSGPTFWRRVIHQNGYRLTYLLWKPLPHYLANGRVLFYNVTCWDENAQVIADKGNCSPLNMSQTSCVLKLPLGRCSCSISASTAVGASPKAQIWFNKANEKESPPPSRLSVTAVHDKSLKLNWAPPTTAGPPQSGFVLEWFVVTQQNNTSLHWERVNSSNTTIITEGVEPFKRYAVSVRALYSNEGPGQSKTVHVYTRQGAPSAGPKVQVQISGRNVKLSWTLPVEQLHGFIQNYTLHYGTGKRVVLPGDVEQYSLSLSPGHYEFCMQASTEAGEGVIGPTTSVHISSEETSIIIYAIISLGIISLVLMLLTCLAQNKIVKIKLCKDIPDPYHSSLANWSPKTMMVKKNMVSASSDIKYSEVILLGDQKKDNYESDQDQSSSYLEVYSYSAIEPTYKPFKCEAKYFQNQRTTNMVETNFTSCPAIYSFVLLSNAEEPSSEPQHQSFHNVKDFEQPLEGASELRCTSTKSLHLAPYLKQHCNIVCPYKLSIGKSSPMISTDSSFQHNNSASCLPFAEFLSSNFMNQSSSIQGDPYLPV